MQPINVFKNKQSTQTTLVLNKCHTNLYNANTIIVIKLYPNSKNSPSLITICISLINPEMIALLWQLRIVHHNVQGVHVQSIYKRLELADWLQVNCCRETWHGCELAPLVTPVFHPFYSPFCLVS